MWDNLLYFWDMNPELHPAAWLLLGYPGMYLVLLLTCWIWIHLRKSPPPYIDEIVHMVTFTLFVLLSLAVVICVVWIYYQPTYIILWYHGLVYGLLFLINLMVLIALVPRLRSA